VIEKIIQKLDPLNEENIEPPGNKGIKNTIK
jgi:hypothetical protein